MGYRYTRSNQEYVRTIVPGSPEELLSRITTAMYSDDGSMQESMKSSLTLTMA